ncbi:MAG: MBL fold metallo-hydrolase [Deltaproteobacteria bacterium]|nr:MBL fold metallo-hydrolase [Deltaproteobacteria bacterium]
MTNTTPQPISITPHLFQLGLPSFPVYLSIGEEGMLIEGGTGPTSDIIVRQIRDLGIDPSRIKYLALTHTHNDHVGALPRLKKMWPQLEVLGGSIAAKFLKKDRFIKGFLPDDHMITDILIKRGEIQTAPVPLDEYVFEVDTIITEGDKIDLGAGIIWQVHQTPGHSPCHMSFYEEKEQTLTLGDMTGYFDPCEDVFWPNYFASLADYCESIKKMASLPAARGILSHNGVIEGNVNRHLEKALKATEAYHQELLIRLDRGEDEEQICTDKADWVCTLGALASYKVIHFLCRLLINQSLADRNKDLFSFPEAQAA